MIGEAMKFRKEKLFYYSPYSFLRQIDKNMLYESSVLKPLLNAIDDDDSQVVEITSSQEKHFFIIQHLQWDSNYFRIPTYKILAVLYKHDDYVILKQATEKFCNMFFKGEKKYCFIEIPSEDNYLIQALCENRFKLIETRLNCFFDNFDNYNYERFPVRKAVTSDIENLRRVAAEMINYYDRIHSDAVFTLSQANDYLATYTEEAIKGFCDIVLVPDDKLLSSDAFLVANKPVDVSGVNIAKILLTAVSSKTCKGWLRKLLSEMIYILKEMNSDYVTVTTQSANRAAFHIYSSSGFKLGSTTHIISRYL